MHLFNCTLISVRYCSPGGQYEYDRKDGESFIDLISSSRQQVTMLLKSGQMKGLGVQYHDHRIIVGFVGDALTGNPSNLLPNAVGAHEG